jgi:hypothetical protein
MTLDGMPGGTAQNFDSSDPNCGESLRLGGAASLLFTGGNWPVKAV